MIFSITLAIALAALVVATHIECASVASVRPSRTANKSAANNAGPRSASSSTSDVSPSTTLHAARPQKRTFGTKVRAFFQYHRKVDNDARPIELVDVDNGRQAIPSSSSSSLVDVEKQEEAAGSAGRIIKLPPKYERRCDAIYIR
jgi:hypothetical protein